MVCAKRKRTVSQNRCGGAKDNFVGLAVHEVCSCSAALMHKLGRGRESDEGHIAAG
eukprot:COSAG03_NODE_23559_length_279_cov_0.572222_1_plen_55_part_01